MPWLFDIQYWLITKFAPTRWLFHHLGYLLGARGLMRLIAEHDPDVVISTYPGVTAVLGMLRENRRLEIPVQSAITDLAGLRFWAHPGVDLHFVTHPESIEEVEKLVGPGSVEWVRPPISRDFLMPRTRRDAREALDVPDACPASCSSPAAAGGSATSRARSARPWPATTPWSSASPAATRSPARSWRSSFGDNEQVRVLGFTEQMSDWMAAADAMIHATAGLTVLEAHIRGCPVVSYGFSAGHLRANNAAFERFGLAEVARSSHELESILRHVTRERQSPDSSFASLPSIASRALSVRPRVRPQPVWRLRTERVAAAVALPSLPIVLAVALVQRESPWSVAKPVTSRIHLGKENEPTSATSRGAGTGSAQAAATVAGHRGDRRSLIARRGGRRARRGRASPTPARPWRRSYRHSATRCAVVLRQDGAEGVALTFDDGPHPQGTPAVLETLREAGAGRPSSSPASRWCGGRPWRPRSSPPATGSSCTATATATSCGSVRPAARRRRAGEGGDRGGERPGGRRLPASLRDLQRRRPTGGARPRLAAGALVAVGAGLDASGDADFDRRKATATARAGDVLLLHDADYYSAPDSWVRTAAALPIILEELEARGLKSMLLRRGGAAATIH